jgi:hypothetical protein
MDVEWEQSCSARDLRIEKLHLRPGL